MLRYLNDPGNIFLQQKKHMHNRNEIEILPPVGTEHLMTKEIYYSRSTSIR